MSEPDDDIAEQARKLFSGPIEFLKSAPQLEHLPPGVTAEPYGEVELRGFPGSIDVVSLSGVPQSASLDAAELWTRSPFI